MATYAQIPGSCSYAWLDEQCIAQWANIQHGVLPGTIADVHAAEVSSLMRMGRPVDGFVEQTKRVSPTSLIGFERNRYSVPRFFATVDLVNALEQEKAANNAGQLAERLLKLDLIILDELRYLPFSPSGGALSF